MLKTNPQISSVTWFWLVQGVKLLLSNKIFGLECKMKSFNVLSNKVLIGQAKDLLMQAAQNKICTEKIMHIK